MVKYTSRLQLGRTNSYPVSLQKGFIVWLEYRHYQLTTINKYSTVNIQLLFFSSLPGFLLNEVQDKVNKEHT
jgi:hypothetical protein